MVNRGEEKVRVHHLKSSPTFSVRPCSSVGRVTEQVREARKRKIKPFLLENDANNFLAASVGSRARLNHAHVNVVPRSTGNTNSGTRELTLKCKL